MRTVRVFRHDCRQRAPTLEADLETNVRESQDQAIRGALRAAHGHHARNPASDGKVLVRVEQGIGEGADVLRRHFLQGTDGIGGDQIPGQQRDDVRNQRRRQFFVPAKNREDAIAIARSKRHDVLNLGIDDRSP